MISSRDAATAAAVGGLLLCELRIASSFAAWISRSVGITLGAPKEKAACVAGFLA
jgi:hypothetical protein